MLCGGCLLNQVCRRSVCALQADCANSRCLVRMPRKKANRGAFKPNNPGHGLRNAGVDAADEPDAGARANECPPCRTCTHINKQAHAHARTHTHTHTQTHTHAHTRTHTPARTHARTHAQPHTHGPAWPGCGPQMAASQMATSRWRLRGPPRSSQMCHKTWQVRAEAAPLASKTH